MITENDINELKSWVSCMEQAYVNETITPFQLESLGAMINILYGRKARKNKYNRGKTKYRNKWKVL